MHQPRTNLSKAFSKGRTRRRPPSPQIRNAPTISPLDAIVRGLASIGERFFEGPAPIPGLPEWVGGSRASSPLPGQPPFP